MSEKVWRDGSAVKSECFLFRDQNSLPSTHIREIKNNIIPAPEEVAHSSGLHRHANMHSIHVIRHICRHIK